MHTMRARIKEQITEEQINQIKDIELHNIGYKYFVEHRSQLDIAFELDVSEKTINRRIKEIYLQFSK